MDYQKKNSTIGANARLNSKRAAEDASKFDTNSVKSFYQTGGLKSSNRSRAVKQLFDSEYVKPEENFRVL